MTTNRVDSHQLVDEIQTAIFSLDSVDLDLIRELAAIYSEACDELNRNLRKCHELLGRGLRTQAITECEKSNVLDQVVALDFPEREQWCEILRANQIVLPPALRLNFAADLNEAYADQSSIESLLKRNRLLALARASLAARVVTLRKIQRADPVNPVWQDDLKLLEQARIAEIGRQLEPAFNEADYSALGQIAGELNSGDWSITPDASIVERATRYHQQLSINHAHGKLEQVAAQLNDAYAAFDVRAGHVARERWVELLPAVGQNLNHALAESAAPALDWLADQDRQASDQSAWENSCNSLAQLLNSKPSLERLERQYHNVLLFERGIPEPLEQRYEQRVRSLKSQASRKFFLRIAAIAATVLAIAAMIAWLINRQIYSNQVVDAVSSIQGFADPDQHDKGKSYIANLEKTSTTVFQSTKVQSAILEFEDQCQQEQQRQQNFQSEMSKAKEAGPESITEQKLKLLGSLARTESEQSELSEFQILVDEKQKENQDRVDSEFTAKLDGLRTKFKELESDESLGLTELHQQLKELHQEATKQISGSGRVSAHARKSADAFAKLVATKLETASSAMREEKAREQITLAVGDPAKFWNAIRDFRTKFPLSESVRDFQNVVKEADLLHATLSWSNFYSNVPSLETLNAEQAVSLLRVGSELATLNKRHPLIERFLYIAPVLASVGKRPAAIKDLETLLNDQLVQRLWMVKTKEGERFYALDEPKEVVSITVEFVIGYDLSKDKARLQKDEIDYSGPAPHSKLAEAALKKLHAEDKENWEAKILSLLEGFQSSSDVDPILRFLLLKRILKAGTEGSAYLASSLEKHIKWAAKPSFDEASRWMLPKDGKVAQERSKAKSDLERMPPLKSARDQVAKLMSTEPPGGKQLRWVGWVGRDWMGNWKLFHKELTQDQGDGEFVVLERSQSGDVKMNSAGWFKSGKITLNWSEDSLEGRPVYLRTTAKEST